MNKLSIYILLVLVFLGLSKTFSPSARRVDYIENEYAYSTFFKGSPISVILIDYFKAGFLIKTYFHGYKIVHGFKRPEYVTVRVSKKFWKNNLSHLGMSLFQRREFDSIENKIPTPPGSVFIGDPSFGYWEEDPFLQDKVWHFHRAYKNFPEYFSWSTFIPTLKFYQELTLHLSQTKIYFGPHREFGTHGTLTRKIYPHVRAFTEQKKTPLKQLFYRAVQSPWIMQIGRNYE